MRTISVVSLGNNVGKTTAALNLGMALRNAGSRVVVFDMGFDKPNLHEHLNMDVVPIKLSQVLSEEKHINDIMLKHVSGLEFIPAEKTIDFRKVFMHLPYIERDYVIIDASSNPEILAHTLKNSDEAIIVHSPEHSSKIVDDVSRMITKAGSVNLGIIFNMSHPKSVNQIFGVPVLEHIPKNNHIEKSFLAKDIAVHLYPRSDTSKRFIRIAERLRI